MPIERQRKPYEILVRYTEDGAIRGAHAKFLERVIDTDTGEILSEKEGQAEPLALAEEAGLPLSGLVDGAARDALDTVAVLAARVHEVEGERDAAQEETKRHGAQIAALTATITGLQDQVAGEHRARRAAEMKAEHFAKLAAELRAKGAPAAADTGLTEPGAEPGETDAEETEEEETHDTDNQ